MSKPIHILRRDVPSFLRQGYNGRKFKVVVTLELEIPMTAGIWDGGSRDSYSICRLSDGMTLPVPHNNVAPWDKKRQDRKVQTSTEYIVILETIVQGKHLGLTYYVHPDIVKAGYLLPSEAAKVA